jgi:two-component system chemotaxis response regulator CheB
VNRDVVVIGGSAGALDPLKLIIQDLPAGLPAAVVVVLHLAAMSRSALAPILNRVGGMQAVTPRDGDELRPGYVYVPTPDHHLELSRDVIRLTRAPRVNGMRPAVDVLFRTAAAAYGPRVIGVVLSGGLDDGSAGLAAIGAAGGLGIAQSPEDAVVDAMPRNAIKVAAPKHVLPAARIGSVIVHEIHGAEDMTEPSKRTGGPGMEAVGAADTAGEVTGITCPECHGSIWLQTGDGGEVALTCRVGHSFSPESFYEIQSENVEDALWAGVRSLEEQAALAGVMASRASRFNDDDGARRYERRREVATDNAEALRRLILERSEA